MAGNSPRPSPVSFRRLRVARDPAGVASMGAGEPGYQAVPAGAFHLDLDPVDRLPAPEDPVEGQILRGERPPSGGGQLTRRVVVGPRGDGLPLKLRWVASQHQT